jgi:DNA-binding NarL/FixJ family response regulator
VSSLIRVGLVDEHDIVRDGLKVFLETAEDLQFVGEADVPAEALALCEAADVLLFDFLTGYDCFDLIVQMQRRRPQLKVLVLTTNLSEAFILHAVQLGVHGYLFKQLDIDELAAAIRTVHTGGRRFDPEVREVIQKNSAANPGLLAFMGLLSIGFGLFTLGSMHFADARG